MHLKLAYKEPYHETLLDAIQMETLRSGLNCGNSPQVSFSHDGKSILMVLSHAGRQIVLKSFLRYLDIMFMSNVMTSVASLQVMHKEDFIGL